MGKGDRKTKRGKIKLGSYGNTRKHLEPKHKPKAAASKVADKKS